MFQSMVDADAMDDFERQMDRMLHTFFPHEHRGRPRLWRPSTDVYETDDAAIVKIEVAGMAPEDFTISFAERTLTVRGVRRDIEAKLSYHCLEIPYGEFHVEVFLTGTHDENAIEAKYDKGFLYITLPKAKQEHRVPVRAQTP